MGKERAWSVKMSSCEKEYLNLKLLLFILISTGEIDILIINDQGIVDILS